MFDLPVGTRRERKAAHDFRLSLLDMGFEMSQFSVYLRFCTSTSLVQTYCRAVERALPQGGRVNILQFTDRQYEHIISFQGKKRQPPYKTPEQYLLF